MSNISLNIFRNSFLLFSLIFLFSCYHDDDLEDSTENIVDEADETDQCTSFNLDILPLTFPISQCGMPGSITLSAMSNINEFWGSDVEACAVVGLNNGLVQDLDPARIYYDPTLLGFWDNFYGTTLPGNIFLAHEYGHVIQNHLFLTNPFKELQADCLAGYFMGYENCRGRVREADLLATYTNFCNIGDTATPTVWWDTSIHGTCVQRVNNLQQGFIGYQMGMLPGEACP